MRYGCCNAAVEPTFSVWFIRTTSARARCPGDTDDAARTISAAGTSMLLRDLISDLHQPRISSLQLGGIRYHRREAGSEAGNEAGRHQHR